MGFFLSRVSCSLPCLAFPFFYVLHNVIYQFFFVLHNLFYQYSHGFDTSRVQMSGCMVQNPVPYKK